MTYGLEIADDALRHLLRDPVPRTVLAWVDRVFLHRDFHPGNVLWSGGRVSGVVDWVSACAGPAEEDVAHCRANLARQHGQVVADQFLRRWLGVVGRSDYHPHWDLLTAVSMASDEPDEALDEFVAAAAAKL